MKVEAFFYTQCYVAKMNLMLISASEVAKDS